MSKFTIALSLVVGAYIAGAGVGTDEVLAFVAPAVPCVTAVGDAIWFAVCQVFALSDSSFPRSVSALVAWVYLIIGAVWAVYAIDEHRFPSKVEDIWDWLPEVDGKKSIPVWAIVAIPLVAVAEFFARVCYFAGFTVVALIGMPLKSMCTFDLRFLSSKSEGGHRA